MYGLNQSQQPRRDLQKIEHDLNAHKDVRGCLDDLLVLFRDSQTRSSEAATDLIPKVVSLFDEEPLKVLMVLINFCANDTENRRYLLSDEASLARFWEHALALEIVEVNHDEGKEGEEENTYLMMLIGQFVAAVEEDEKEEFMDELIEIGVLPWVFKYHEVLQGTADGRREMNKTIDFLIDYAKIAPEEVTESQFYSVVGGYMASVDKNSGYPDTDLLLLHAEFLFHCTNVDDSEENFPAREFQHLFIEVPNDCDERTDILRKLFAACGNIYSFPSYDNWQDLQQKVENLAGGWSFLMASAAISLGNCVSSKDTQNQLIEKINEIDSLEHVAEKFIRRMFEDVIYYQGYHFFNNVMNKELAVSLVKSSNAEFIYENTKVIVDNYAYYKEVGAVYFKFLGKLVNLAFLEGTADITLFEDTWSYLLNTNESTEVVSLVLQGYCRHVTQEGFQPTFQSALVKHLLKLESSIDIAALLHKIKALSVFLKSYSAPEMAAIFGVDFESGFVSQLAGFLVQLESAACDPAQAGDAPAMASSTLANNSRFLALLVQQKLQPMQADHGQAQACTTAARILASVGK